MEIQTELVGYRKGLRTRVRNSRAAKDSREGKLVVILERLQTIC